ncbi:MAG: anti-sigma factor family protein [Planctomycetota bacterium]|jgi:hypothetical protein
MMSENDYIFEQLSAYLDGELSDDEAKRVEQAIRADEALAGELEKLRAMRELLRGLPKAKAPDDLADRVMAQAERLTLVGAAPQRQARRQFRWVRYAAAAAIILLAVGIGVVVRSTFEATGGDGREVAAERDREGAPHAGKPDDKNGKRDGVEVAARDDEGLVSGRVATGPAVPESSGTRAAPGGEGFATGMAPKEGADVGKARGHGGALPAKPGPTDFRHAARAGRAAGKAPAEPPRPAPDLRNINIYVVDSPHNRKAITGEVETVLSKNGLEPLVLEGRREATREPVEARSRTNVYHKDVYLEANQVQFVAFPAREQFAAVVEQLSEAQRRQSRITLPEKAGERLLLVQTRAQARDRSLKARGVAAGEGEEEGQ